MRATRRNVLVILGVLTIAGGALFGTGAFTQVEAQRSVDVNTQGDADAQLGLNITSDDLSGGNGDTIEFAENDLNQNATTTYENAFVISNNDDDSTTINSLSIEDADGNSLVNNASSVLSFETTGSTPLNPGEEITYDVVIDTTNGDISEVPDEITIVASDS